jgi:hypothetical protein
MQLPIAKLQHAIHQFRGNPAPEGAVRIQEALRVAFEELGQCVDHEFAFVKPPDFFELGIYARGCKPRPYFKRLPVFRPDGDRQSQFAAGIESPSWAGFPVTG